MNNNRTNHRRLPIYAAALAATLPALAHAGQSPASPSASVSNDSESSAFDKAWALATLYKDNNNPYIQEFKLRGRYHGQYYKVDADQGNNDHWEDRRSRFGFDAKLFEKKVEVRVDFQSNDGFEDIYDGLVDAYIRWKPSKDLSITVGKTKPLIGQYDWLGSTNSQPTFERSQIFNQLGINRATGITVEGTYNDFSYRAGVYSNDTPSSTGGTGAWGDGEFGDLDGGTSITLGVGYDFKSLLGTETADFRFDWLHSNREADDLVLARYDDILSATFVVEQDAFAIVTEAYYATGGDGNNSDVYGFFIQPTYDIIPKTLQLVGRYSYAHSDGAAGVIAQSRYERGVAVAGGRGDTYHSVYLGAQYFIYGDKLKVLAGAEWAKLDGPSTESYDGLTYLTGLRFSF
ncbi:MAG: porin [Luteolibacter sp.]